MSEAEQAVATVEPAEAEPQEAREGAASADATDDAAAPLSRLEAVDGGDGMMRASLKERARSVFHDRMEARRERRSAASGPEGRRPAPEPPEPLEYEGRPLDGGVTPDARKAHYREEFLARLDPPAEGSAEDVADEAPDGNAAPEGGTDQPRDERGRFMPKRVRVPLPPGHPLRAEGREHLTVPREELPAYLHLVGDSPPASPEPDPEIDRILAAKEEEVIRLRTLMEARQEFNNQLLRDPEIQREFEDLMAISPHAAEHYIRGLEIEHQGEIEERVRERVEASRRERAGQALDREVDAFGREAVQHVRTAYPLLRDLPHLGELATRALQSYATELQARERRGEAVTLDQDAFRRHLHDTVLADPDVRTRLRQGVARQLERRRTDAPQPEPDSVEPDGASEVDETVPEDGTEVDAEGFRGVSASEMRRRLKRRVTSSPEEPGPDFAGVSPWTMKKTLKARVLEGASPEPTGGS